MCVYIYIYIHTGLPLSPYMTLVLPNLLTKRREKNNVFCNSVYGLGFKVEGDSGLGFRVSGLGFRSPVRLGTRIEGLRAPECVKFGG